MTLPSVLAVHNRYRTRSGEDRAYDNDVAILEANGHRVVRLERDSATASPARAAVSAVWSRQAARDLRALLGREAVDVVHVHNTFPLLSPSVYGACRAAGVPVVQTFHNFRITCAASVLYRDGAVCRDCVGRSVPWPAVRHRCYQASVPASALAALAQVVQSRRRVLAGVDLFLVPSLFARGVLVEAGLPADRVAARPLPVVPDPGLRPANASGASALYAGRLSAEKGIADLLAAAARPGTPPVRVAGDGPLRQVVASSSDVTWLGELAPEEVLREMRGAAMVVAPSRGYETFGLAVAEAQACGVPVVATGQGALAEAVRDGVDGLVVPPGDPVALADAMAAVVAGAASAAAMGRAGRVRYEARSSPAVGYASLLDAYRRAMNATD